MARRSSSLNKIDSGISREIGSQFDDVRKVADNINSVVTVAAQDLEALTQSLQEATDFEGITVVQGAVANWDPVTKVLTIPTVKGDKGDTGLKGDTGTTGATGSKGDKGDKGDTGADLTVEQIIYNNNGTFTWHFSDESTYTTPDLRGPKGDRGLQGISVHHIKPTSTTNIYGKFGTPDNTDVYTMYGDSAETIVLGYFPIRNGESIYRFAADNGYIGTEEDLYIGLTKVNEAIYAADTAVAAEANAQISATEAADSATDADISQTSALASANDAADSAAASLTSRNQAEGFASTAESQADIATAKAAETSTSADNASSSASAAGISATNASNSADASSASATQAANSASVANTSATSAESDALAASISATNSLNSATASANSASEAAVSESNASDSETAAANSATASANSATDSAASAMSSADSAIDSANSATQSANSATASASSANSSATSASNAATSESNISVRLDTVQANNFTVQQNLGIITSTPVSTQLANAETHAQTATTKVAEIEVLATTATTQAGIATTKADEASTSATIATAQVQVATTEANIATTKANEASISATSADISANNALSSAQAAGTSETSAEASALSASTSATQASTSEANALQYKNSAQTAATAAIAAKDTAVSVEHFVNATYLGSYSADPTVDNNGDPLVAGAFYFNTVDNKPKIYNGTVWNTAVFDAAGAVLTFNGRDGNVTLTNDDITNVVGVDLSSVEYGATADQTAEEIRALVEAATDSNVFTDADHSKLDNIEAGAQVNVGTDLSYTTAATTGTVTSSTGTAATLPAATTTLAGLLTGEDKTKLDSIETGANNYVHPTGDGNLHVPATGTTNNGKVLTAGDTEGSLLWTLIPSAPVSSVAGKTGAVTLVKDDVGLSNVDNTSDVNKPVSSAVQIALDTKVDKVTGKGLSTEDYTTAEKDKLASLESSRFKGQFISLLELQTAYPTADIGSYANVEEGEGVPVQRYVWDATNAEWVQQMGASSQLTAAQIKEEYESNPDTNAFSDTEKTKLSGIQSGAQVNTVTSVNSRTGDVEGLVESTDGRLSDHREWTAETVSQAEAEAGSATTRRAWTAQRTRQAVLGWWDNSADKTKLDGIEAEAQVNTVTSVVGKTGDVTLDKNDVGLSNVDNTSDIDKPVSSAMLTALNSKVDKVTGKQLSTEDYTTAEKTKLGGIESGAQVNVATNLNYTPSTRVLSSSTGTSVTLPQVTTSVDGLMIAADKIKLNGIEANAKDDQVASEVPVTPVGSLVATDVQTALENLHAAAGTLNEAVVKNSAVTGTNTLVKYDKILGNLDVIEMSYTGGDLTTVRYSGDNNTDSFYRDVLVYSSGNLTSIKHYYNKPDLVTESAETVLVYDLDSNLISTQYTEL